MTDIQGRHNAILEDRSKLMLTGVNDVERFDENTVVLYTQLGELTVKGEKLHISELSVENGELNIDGEISAMVYGQRDAVSRLDFLGKLLR
ncbi:sporulation protein YabP [Ruminococcus albus]|uniref:Sporulation protein YabP n=1 Tax=Ruminococcus albus TaxID=1264 RepID=A0A1H7MZB9_RUMAL|nr:sporulation protein YabP [Ruminococcus albus]SEL15997.1 sporulation protein YabP [Ruminococcus albus]